MPQKQIQLRLIEAWSESLAYIPDLVDTAFSIYVDADKYRDNPDWHHNVLVREANLGSEENPYALFGAFVCALHRYLEGTTTESNGYFGVEDRIEDDIDVYDVDCEPARWYWRYTPGGHILEWEFWMKDKFLPCFAASENSIEGKINASPKKGSIKGSPFTEGYRVSQAE